VCVRERGFLDNQEARRSRPRSAAQERFKGLLNFKKFKAGAAAVEEMCKVGGDSWQGLRGSVLPLQRCRLLFSGPHGPKLRVRVPNTRFECLAPPSSLARCFPWLCICGLGACATAVHTPSKIGDIVARLVGVAPRLLALEGTCCNLQRSLALVLLFDFLCTCLRVRALGFAFLYFSLRRWLLARVAQPQSPLRRHIVPLDLLLNNPKPLSYCYYVYVYVSLFIYMYMYMYLYMYLCMYICTCTCTCTHARARAHTHTHTRPYICIILIIIYRYIMLIIIMIIMITYNTYIGINKIIYIYIYIYIYYSMCVSAHKHSVCACVCLCVCLGWAHARALTRTHMLQYQ
jgi:hypothetical protein